MEQLTTFKVIPNSQLPYFKTNEGVFAYAAFLESKYEELHKNYLKIQSSLDFYRKNAREVAKDRYRAYIVQNESSFLKEENYMLKKKLVKARLRIANAKEKLNTIKEIINE